MRHAAIAQNTPLAGGLLRSVFPEGQDTTTRDRVLVQVNSVSTGYFETIGIPLSRGRDFTRADRPGAPLVVVVNETMAERFWPNQDAIGKRFKFFGDMPTTRRSSASPRNSKYNGVAEAPDPVHLSAAPAELHAAGDAARARETDAASLAAAVRREVQQIDPTLSVFNVRTLEDQVFDSLAPLRTNVDRDVDLRAACGAARVDRPLRRRELLGDAAHARDRRAHGSRRKARDNVLADGPRQGLLLVAIGIMTGLAAAAALMSFVPADLLPNVNGRDPVTLAATAALLAIVALIASCIPAYRATRIDPLVALRAE